MKSKFINQHFNKISIAGLACFLTCSAVHAETDSKHGVSPGAKFIKTLDLGAGLGSYNVAVNHKTNRLYIANSNAGSVSVLDGRTDTVITTIPVGLYPQASAIDEATNTIYTIDGLGTISVINGHTNQVTDSFVIDTNSSGQYGLATQDIVFSKKTGKLYVSNTSTQIDVVDPVKRKVLKTITDDNTNFLAINQRTNKIYVSQYWDGTVLVIDGDKDEVVNTINGVGQPAVPNDCYLGPVGEAGCTNISSGLDHVAVDERTNRVYVAGTNDGRFVTIDGDTNTVIKTQTIADGQYNIAVNALKNSVYTINFATSDLYVINGANGKLTDTLSVGAGFVPAGCYSNQTACTSFGDLPSGLAFNPETGKIYVVDAGNFLDPTASSTLYVFKATETGHGDHH